jgi:F-type H+-transporting ATPase subunit b
MIHATRAVHTQGGESKLRASIRCSVVVGIATLLFATPALAAGGEHGPTTMDLIWQAVNLAILLGVIFYMARKPVSDYFATRRSEIQNDIESASQLLASAEQTFKEWQGKVVDLEGELDEIKATARRRAEEERDQILATARDSAERIKGDALAAVDQQLRRAQEELRHEAAELAVDLAAGMLRDQVDDRDRDRLMDEFITRVEPAGSGR